MIDIKNSIENIFKDNPLIKEIIKKIIQNGARAFLVGGAVRDILLGLKAKDLDIEIHGLKIEDLEKILKSFGPVSLVGKSFGVFRLHNIDADWSLPRTDSQGRKPIVKIDPFMSIKNAFARRDLTINAMGIDLNTSELIDPFNGKKDLENKILRAPDKDLFIQDPLRFFRVMQFIGRFEMQPDYELNQICKTMNIKNISRERIEEEFKKLFLKSKRPSLGIEWLRHISRLSEILPEVAELIGVIQDKNFHPEGDVYEHTLQSLDAAAKLKYDSDEEKLILMWAAFCHDLGKVSTTKEVNGKIISYEHEQESEILSKKLLKRITKEKDLIDAVCKLVKYHMQPIQFLINKAKPTAYKRMANRLAPNVTLQMLGKLALIDKLARNPKKGSPLEKTDTQDVDEFLSNAKKLDILTKIEKPILLGRDIKDIVKPGPEMGKFLKIAYDIQLEKGIKDKDELKKQTLKIYSKK